MSTLLATAANAAGLTSPTFSVANNQLGTASTNYSWSFAPQTGATLSTVHFSVPAGTSGQNRYLALQTSTSANLATALDSPANSPTAAIDIRAHVALANYASGSFQSIVSKFWNGINQASYRFGVASNGTLQLQISSGSGNGSSNSGFNSTASLGLAANSNVWIRGTYLADNGSGSRVENFYTSTNGTTWTQLGATQSAVGVAPIFDSTDNVGIGFEPGGFGQTTGRIYYADIRGAINGAPSNVFDPSNAPADISPNKKSWTSSTGETWTIQQNGSGTPADIASDLGTASVSGLPSGGTAVLRQIEGSVDYNLASNTSVPATTPCAVTISGLANTQAPGNYPSTISTYDASSTLVDSATTGTQAFGTAPTTATWTVMDPRANIPGNRYDWTLPATATNYLTRVSATVPSGTSAQARYLALDGTAGNYVTAPSSSANTITTAPIDLRAELAPSAWTWTGGATYRYLVTKVGYGTNQIGYGLVLDSTGQLQFVYSINGSTQQNLFSVGSVPFTGTQTGWVRVNFVPNDGSGNSTVTFYTSTDGTNWTTLGANTTIVGSSVSVYNSTSSVAVGAAMGSSSGVVNGKIYYADVRNNYAATTTSTSGCATSATIADCMDPNQAPATISTGTPTWTSQAPVSPLEVWTVTRGASWQPADIAADLSVVNVAGMPSGGTGLLRQMDGMASYILPTATIVLPNVSTQFGLMGFTNTSVVASPTSIVRSYDNSATPVVVSSGTTAAVAFTSPTANSWSASPTTLSALTPASQVDTLSRGMFISGTKMYVADYYANVVRKVDMTTGNAIDIAGNGTQGAGGSTTALLAGLNQPTAVVADSSGNVYVMDGTNGVVRKIDTSGNISVVVGGGSNSAASYSGLGTTVRLTNPRSLGIDGSNNLYIGDTGANNVRKMDTSGNVTPFAGTGVGGYNGDGAAATSTQITGPQDIAVDSSGDVFLADPNNNRIREVLTNGTMTTVAGSGTAGFSGDSTSALTATLNTPYSVAVDSSGVLYIGDQSNNRVRKVSGGIITTIAGTGSNADSGDGSAATAAGLAAPQNVRVDSSGNVYIADWGGSRIRKITGTTISTYMGTGSATWNGDGGNVSKAHFWFPSQLASDPSGNVYVADTRNQVVRKINKWGVVSTVAGAGPSNQGFGGDGFGATSALLNSPVGVAWANNTLYISDSGNNRIRQVDSNGNISTLVNLGSTPGTLAIGPTGNVYVETGDCRIVQVTAAGVATTVAGTSGTCTDTGDGGLATAATINTPSLSGLTVDANGTVYVAQSSNGHVREIDSSGHISLAGGGGGSTLDNASAMSTSLSSTSAMTTDTLGNLIVSTPIAVRQFRPGGPVVYLGGSTTGGNGGDGGGANIATWGSIRGLVESANQLYTSDTVSSRLRRIADSAPIAPYVNADTETAAKNTAASWNIESNDWDIDGEMDPNSVTIVGAPTNGTAAVAANQGQITNINYTPSLNFTGSDSLIYRACDSTLVQCATATVSITVGSDQVTTIAGGTTEGDASNISFSPYAAARFKGYVFLQDNTFNVLRRYDIYSHQLTTFAGNAVKGYSGDGGPANQASISGGPPRVGVDGTVIFPDAPNDRLRSVAPNGIITTIAGTGSGGSPTAGTAATAATFSTMPAANFDNAGNVLVSTTNQVWQFAIGGNLSLVAGVGTSGSAGDGGSATSAQLNNPMSLAVESNGDIVISDSGNQAIRKVHNAILSTIAGTLGTTGFSGDGFAATTATFSGPKGISIDSAGTIYVADSGNSRVRQFTDGGNISTLAGSTSIVSPGDPAAMASPGSIFETSGTNSRFYSVSGGAAAGLMNLGSDGYGFGGDGTTAQNTQLSGGLTGLVADALGNLTFLGSDPRMRRLDTNSNTFSTTAGNSSSTYGATSWYHDAGGITYDLQGRLVFADSGRVRRINADGSITTIAGNGSVGDSGDGGLATNVPVGPNGVAYDSLGNLYIATTDRTVRKVDTSGYISTIAGNGGATDTGDGGPAVTASISEASRIAVGPDNTPYLLEKNVGFRVRQLDVNGIIAPTIGDGGCQYNGDGLLARGVRICNPSGFSVDTAGNIFIADTSNLRIRKIDAATGIVSTIAGNGTTGYTAAATQAGSLLNTVRSVYAAPNGNVYFWDQGTNRIGMIKGVAAVASPDALASATSTASPAASGHSNLRDEFTATPALASASSKMSFTLPVGFTGTPTLVSQYGFSGAVTVSTSAGALNVTYPAQTLAPGVHYAVAIEGITSGGYNGAYSSTTALYDSGGTAAIGWARSTILNLSNSGAPVGSDPGYASVWGKTLSATQAGASATLSLSPVLAATSDRSTSFAMTTAGVLNSNAELVSANALMSNGQTLLGTTPNPSTTNSALGINAYGLTTSSITGTVATASNYFGAGTSAVSVVSNAAATNTTSFTLRARIDYLTPAGKYQAQFTTRLSPGT